MQEATRRRRRRRRTHDEAMALASSVSEILGV